ncbi:MAG: rhodanese-like domain-containing protein [gamma proteobacterium symbiont of Bathyaustriella thionipta]|nr:rhodanese-like domain-containing protein [gamma proteobacterium symbiont of Bathyaustriella thionipta]
MRRINQQNVLAILSAWLLPAILYATGPLDMPDRIEGAETVDAEGLISLVSERPIVLIDARISSDRLEGFIEGSISLPDVETNCHSLSRLLPDKHSEVLFYCNGVKCGRSVKSIRTALACGYDHLYWFRGGFEEWTEKEFPVVKR